MMSRNLPPKPRLGSKAAHREIYTEVFPPKLSKSDKRRFEIMEGAIKAYSAVSYEHVTFDDVALPASTSRRLVKHYFPDKDKLFENTMKLIRALYQAAVIEAFTAIPDPGAQFSEYVRAAVSWAQEEPTHVRAWILYYLVCSQQKKFRQLHEELADMGEKRIISLIRAMAPPKSKALKDEDLHFAAKTIQRIITGALIEICSERVQAVHAKIESEAVRACQLIVSGLLTRA